MGKRWFHRRLAALSAFSIMAVLASVTLFASAAQAVTFYPRGCKQTVTNSWDDSCWVGYDYVRNATMVLGVQYLLNGSGLNSGTPDCYFGSRTDTATIAFQRRWQLSQDGIVGGDTWLRMSGQTRFSGVTDVYGMFFNIGADGLRYYYQNQLAGVWFVLNPYHTPDRYGAMSQASGRPSCPN